MLLIALLLSLSLPALADGPPAPDAAGPFGVGHSEFAVTDPARADRPLNVQVWYPVDPVDYVGAPTEYPVIGLLTVISKLAIDDLPVAAGRHPLIVFSHGSGGINTQSTALCEGLASHGFIVAAPNHTGNTTDDFQNGTGVSFLQSAVDRPIDVSFIIDSLRARSAAAGDLFEAHVRGEGFGVAGHSFGGYTAFATRTGFDTAPADDRISAVMAVAPASGLIDDDAFRAFDRPLLLLSGTLDTTTPIDDNTTRPFALVPTDVYRIDVINATHTHFANIICDFGNALLSVQLTPDLWPAVGADALIQPWFDTCVPPAFPLAEVERIQNLYAVSYFRRFLMNDTRYQPFLHPSYANANEPDVQTFPIDKVHCGIGFELAFVILPIAGWRHHRRSRRLSKSG
jgi:predicted dienelactone hydrolase